MSYDLSISNPGSSSGHRRGSSDQRSRLAEALRFRAPEINQAILDRLLGVEGEDGIREIDYLQGLHEAVVTGVEYAIDVIGTGEGRMAQPPLPVLTQARLAARHRIPLHRVLHRYLAAKTIFTRFVLREAGKIPNLEAALVSQALATQDSVFERLVTTASEEHLREEQMRNSTHESRLVSHAQRLLSGEQIDSSLFDYDLGGYHLGLVAFSKDSRPLLRALGKDLGRRMLILSPRKGETWAWLGSREPLDPDHVSRWAGSAWVGRGSLGLGEPAEGESGWRRTHEQAREAGFLARSACCSALRYGDIALVASAAKDPLLLTFLNDMYLSPLGQPGVRTSILHDTLSAFFSADRNGASAAAKLGVSRQTVTNRLRKVEECVAQPLSTCGDLVHIALRLHELGLIQTAKLNQP